jgi:hypothetical protein
MRRKAMSNLKTGVQPRKKGKGIAVSGEPDTAQRSKAGADSARG